MNLFLDLLIQMVTLHKSNNYWDNIPKNRKLQMMLISHKLIPIVTLQLLLELSSKMVPAIIKHHIRLVIIYAELTLIMFWINKVISFKLDL